MEVQLLIMFLFGVVTAAVAASKGRNAVGWFFIGFFFTLVGLVIALVVSNKKEEQEHRRRALHERRRLREQLRQERIKNNAFRQHAASRLDSHDHVLGVDTRSDPALPDARPPAQIAGAAEAPQAPPPPPTALWYYEHNGGSIGPLVTSDVKGLLQKGVLSEATLLWNEHLGEWTPLRDIPQFQVVPRP
jgi:hypothetical protein